MEKLTQNIEAGVNWKEVLFKQYGIEKSAFVQEKNVENLIEKLQEKGCKIVDIEER